MNPIPCGAAELLRRGGPVQVPLRECCAAALIGVNAATPGCLALDVVPDATVPPASPSKLPDGTGVRW